jgi:hypothetical protein
MRRSGITSRRNGQLLDEPDILQQDRTARPCSLDVDIILTGVPDAWANGVVWIGRSWGLRWREMDVPAVQYFVQGGSCRIETRSIRQGLQSICLRATQSD